MERQAHWGFAAVVTCVIIITAFAQSASSQDFSLWGTLTPGPHAVGFETVEVRDMSRSFQSGKDYYGAEVPGETVRMVQILIWYPAVSTDDDITMTWGEYAYPYPEDPSFGNMVGQMQNRDLTSLFMFLSRDRGLVSDVMYLSLRAVRGAAHADGAFPLVIYHSGAQMGTIQNLVLCEYLASRGYIVATTHSIGAFAVNPGPTAVDLEAMTRDKEFVLSQLTNYPTINPQQIATVGFGRGGSSALLQAMRNPMIDGVVLLEGAIGRENMYDDLTSNPFFDIRTANSPMLYVSGDTPQGATRALLDSLAYTERYLGNFTSMRPTDFTNYAIVSTMRSDSTAPPAETVRSGYELACQVTADFVGQSFEGTETSRAEALNAHARSDRLSFEHLPGEPLPPTPNQLITITRTYGVDSVVALCERFGLATPENPIWDANTVNGIGYQLLQRGQIADARKIMKIGVDCYPTLANAWDSYGEATAADGDIEGAIACYEKALELVPTDATITPNFRAQLETSIPATIERLKERLAAESETGQ